MRGRASVLQVSAAASVMHKHLEGGQVAAKTNQRSRVSSSKVNICCLHDCTSIRALTRTTPLPPLLPLLASPQVLCARLPRNVLARFHLSSVCCAVAGNYADFVAFHREQKHAAAAGSNSTDPASGGSGSMAERQWYTDYAKMSYSALMFYGYVFVLGLVLFFALRWFR